MILESQDKMVLHYMAKHKSITSLEAFEELGITRLSARIFNLREAGHDIGMVWEETPNRFGKMVRYGRFFIKKLNKGALK